MCNDNESGVHLHLHERTPRVCARAHKVLNHYTFSLQKKKKHSVPRGASLTPNPHKKTGHIWQTLDYAAET